jgi:hypothetical protein
MGRLGICSGLLVLFLIGVTVAACEGTGNIDRPIASPEPEIASIFEASAVACEGVAVAGAGSVIESVANHLVVLTEAGTKAGLMEDVPATWLPSKLDDTEYVVCLGPSSRVQVEVCPYLGGADITRYRLLQPVTVVEAASGREVASFTVTAEPRSCQRSELSSTTTLEGIVKWPMLETELASLVTDGRYVAPGESPGPARTPRPGASAEPEPTPAGEAIELSDAMAAGLIDVRLNGESLESLNIEITSLASEPSTIVVEAGTFFDPRRDATQSMVALWDTEIELEPGESTDRDIAVACGEMKRDGPDDDDVFSVRPAQATGDLARLLAAPGLIDKDFRVQQFAIWTVTNNPRRNGYVPLGTTFDIFGSGPSKDEMAQIRELFEAADIDQQDYRALR